MMTTPTLRWAQRMSGDMQIAGLSERTEAAYLRAVRQLAKFYQGRSPEDLSEADVRWVAQVAPQPGSTRSN